MVALDDASLETGDERRGFERDEILRIGAIGGIDVNYNVWGLT